MIKNKWPVLSAILVAFISSLIFLNWERLPFFLDIYYHLLVMRGFDLAGGVVTHAFWELAPIGQTLLYPPLFHLLLLAVYKLGLPLITTARLMSVLPFVLLLVTANLVVSRSLGKKTAFFVTAALCIPYTFFLKLTITVPVTLCLIFILIVYYAIENRRLLAASIFTSLTFYTHLGMPWILLLSLAVYGMLKKDARRMVFLTIALSLLFSVPIILHLAANIGQFESLLGIKMPENSMFEIYPLLYLFLGLGLLRLKDRSVREKSAFFVALFFGFLPMAVNYRYRLLSAEGLLPVLFFAGIGLQRAYDGILDFAAKMKASAFTVSLSAISFVMAVNFFCPTLSVYVPLEPPYDKKEFAFYWRDSTVINLLPRYKRHLRPFEISLYDAESRSWIEAVEKNTEPDDIICVNDVLLGSLVSAFSGRANAARLFLEVKEPNVPISELGASKLLIWLRESTGEFSSDLKKGIEKFKFNMISYDDYAAILTKPDSLKVKPVKPVLSLPVAFLILSVILIAGFLDLSAIGLKAYPGPRSSSIR